MVLGLRTKTRKDSAFNVDFNILIQEISPWPPSESLKSLRSVVLFWENGERNSGKTSTVAPSIGSGSASGKIEFNEFISLQAVFQKEGSSKSGKWQKNLLELNLYEPRRDKLKGQHLGTATLDLAEHAMFHEDSSVPVPLNSKRSFKSNSQPMVYLRIQPLDGDNSSVSSRDALSKEASVDKDSKDFVSATMSEEYTEDTEFASFTDDDEEEAPYTYCSGGTVLTGRNRSHESLKDVAIALAHENTAIADDGLQVQEPIRISNNRNDSKVRELELKVELLEAELREVAAAEIGLYSIIAEHGSSVNKVHTPARRLSRHFVHALKNFSRDKMGSAARSATSGLVLVAKACGYDIARLSFWLSNCVVLRGIVTETSKQSGTANGINSSDVDTFIAAIKKIESWIFSRIVETLWWQTFTPHMQSAHITSDMKTSSNAKKAMEGLLLLEISNKQPYHGHMEKAFKEASERLCPIGSWSRSLTDLFGMDMDDYPDVENAGCLKMAFSLWKILTIRHACSSIFPAVRITWEGNKGIHSIPCSASPIPYSPPASGAILSVIGDPRKSGSAILRKSNTSDDELDELSSPLTFISNTSSNPLAKLKRISNSSTARYRFLHEVWKLDDQ
ncbi:hypothetical protein HU200_059422 [Digitaria exilis]|uniref:C2 NT-type domain-containing protein n=1 Tax=Digitaria exilis TaxID=1010633 RepID=A0A835AGB8_9POAL|nr:hypothetical protein HU200_059422 [Digitaria exilis]